MNRSIRLRIALAVFTVVVSLVALQILYVLSRFEHSFVEETDDRLEEDLSELRVVLGGGQLAGWMEQTTGKHRREDELFVEIRDANDAVVARSANLPETGFPGAPNLSMDGGRVYWDFVNPRSSSSAQHVRAVETWVGPWHVRIGMSIEEVQRWYWSLRKNLITSLVLIALVGALSAYFVAERALLPIARIAAQARALGNLPDGTLPRTGSGDEVDRLAAVLNDLLRRIRAEVLRVRRLTADAGHALRTPLTAIRGHLELQAAHAEGGAAESLATAIEQVDELVRFVNRLLLLEKLESGFREFGPSERLDLLAHARTLVDHLQIIAEDRGVALECRGESTLVDADPGQIRQAILNLLDNALRHTPRGGKVTITVSPRANGAEVAIEDTGAGLPTDQLERVFERFYSTRAGSGAGTGLGLPIARAIARAYGGEVTAASPAGARFVLRLPAAA